MVFPTPKAIKDRIKPGSRNWRVSQYLHCFVQVLVTVKVCALMFDFPFKPMLKIIVKSLSQKNTR